MDLLRRIFPYSFKRASTTSDLVISILIYLVAGIIAGALIAVLSKVLIIGFIFAIVGSLVDLYVAAGIVVLLLNYFNVLK